MENTNTLWLVDTSHLSQFDDKTLKQHIQFYNIYSWLFFITSLAEGIMGYFGKVDSVSIAFFSIGATFFVITFVFFVIGILLEKKNPIYQKKNRYLLFFSVSILLLIAFYFLNFLTTKYDYLYFSTYNNYFLYLIIVVPIATIYYYFLLKHILNPLKAEYNTRHPIRESPFISKDKIAALTEGQIKEKIVSFGNTMILVFLISLSENFIGYIPFYNLQSNLFFVITVFLLLLFIINIVRSCSKEKQNPIFKKKSYFYGYIAVTIFLLIALFFLNFLTSTYTKESDLFETNILLVLVVVVPVQFVYGYLLLLWVTRYLKR
jgi:drug/metabolite transporter (DMT)-like permease